GNAGRMAAVTTDDAEDLCAAGAGVVNCRDQVTADVLLGAAATYREHEYCIARGEAAHLEPFDVGALPALIVDPRGELGDVVGRGVTLDAEELAKVIHGVRAVAGAAAHAKEEYASAIRLELHQHLDDFLYRGQIQPLQDRDGLVQMLLRVAHA